MTPQDRHPPVVTFAIGAKLLMEEGLVESITAEGLRYIANHATDWPFGDGREHPYGSIGNAKTMATEPFLDYFRARPRRGGRGRRKKE